MPNRSLLSLLAFWLLAFGLIAFPYRYNVFINLTLYISYYAFWFRLVGKVREWLVVPADILLGGAILMLLVDSLLVNATVYQMGFGQVGSGFEVQAFKISHIFVLAAFALLISLLVSQNGRGKTSGLLVLSLLFAFGTGLLAHESRSGQILLSLLLFAYLLKATTWLATLSKRECWLYLAVFALIFRGLWGLDLFSSPPGGPVLQENLWYTFPRFGYLLVLSYLLALLIKTPVVLVYNFATLSRKLKISTLFQSTFPLLTQLAMLVTIFYFFISGVQAERIRTAIESVFKQAENNSSVLGEIGRVTLPSTGREMIVEIGDRRLRLPPGDLPEYGVLESAGDGVNEKSTVFIFHRTASDNDDESRQIYLTPVDSNFVRSISDELSILAGTQLLAYRYVPDRWEAFLHDFKLGDLSFWGGERNLQIFPFAISPQESQDKQSASIGEPIEDSQSWMAELQVEVAQKNYVTLGRLVAPLVDPDGDRKAFYAFEILVTPNVALFRSSLAWYLLFLVLAYLAVSLVVIRRMVKFGSEINQTVVQRFNQLKTGIRQLAEGNLDYKIRIEGRDEFVELGERFNYMGEKLQDSIAEVREKERLQHELTIARQVQLDLLPRELPVIPGFDVAANLQTANEVGGDFYDVIAVSEHEFLFAIGDVSGKGTSAAFYMAQCISLFRYTPQFTRSPADIAARLNHYFADSRVDRHIFVTVIVGLVDNRKNVVRLIRAGHPKPLLVPGDSSQPLTEVNCRGIGVGLSKDRKIFASSLEETTLNFKKHDSIVLVTDGVEEAAKRITRDGAAPGPTSEFYTFDRIKQTVAAHREKSAARMLSALSDDIAAFYAGHQPVDDYTILILKRGG